MRKRVSFSGFRLCSLASRSAHTRASERGRGCSAAQQQQALGEAYARRVPRAHAQKAARKRAARKRAARKRESRAKGPAGNAAGRPSSAAVVAIAPRFARGPQVHQRLKFRGWAHEPGAQPPPTPSQDDDVGDASDGQDDDDLIAEADAAEKVKADAVSAKSRDAVAIDTTTNHDKPMARADAAAVGAALARYMPHDVAERLVSGGALECLSRSTKSRTPSCWIP